MIRTIAAGIAIATSALLVSAAPASAHTLDQAVRAAAGCGWSSGSYTLQHSSAIRKWSGSGYTGAIVGNVHLLWSSTYQQNCVVTLKVAAHGTNTLTRATLNVQRSGNSVSYVDSGQYAHYAAVARNTRGECVSYSGFVRPIPAEANYGGRSSWGNCG